jgi:hypothetical protein
VSVVVVLCGVRGKVAWAATASPRSSLHRGCGHVPQKRVLLPQATTRSHPQVVDCETSVVWQA